MNKNDWINYLKGEARDIYIKNNCKVIKGYKNGKKIKAIDNEEDLTIDERLVYVYRKMLDLAQIDLNDEETIASFIYEMEQVLKEYNLHPKYNSKSQIKRNWKNLAKSELFSDHDDYCALREFFYKAGFFD